MTFSTLSLSAFPDSPYAAELKQGPRNLRFASPALEAEYIRADLLQGRTLVRVACTLAALLVVFRGLEQGVGDAWATFFLLDYLVVIAGSGLLLTLAWSQLFETSFLPCARVVIPLRNSLVAVHIAGAAAHGHLEMLMLLPALLIGPFFLMRLRYRSALRSGILAVVCFVVAALVFPVALPVALRSSLLMVMALIACAIAARHLEWWSRSSFLESHIFAELAQQDALTGTKNRRVFDEYLTRLWPEAMQNHRTIAILLIDVDHFKAYNDRYGHQAGDHALRRVAQTVQKFVRRPLDVLARYGGEEFGAILYDVDGKQAMDIAGQIHRAVGELEIEGHGSRGSTGVTISVGVAVIQPTMQRNSRGALQLADQALYEAKARGRNRVELMDEAQYRMLVTGSFSTVSLARR